MAEEVVSPESKVEINEFLLIKDRMGEVIYTCDVKEFEEVIDNILSLGVYTKTFKLFGGKIELTFETITDEQRGEGFEFIRAYMDKNTEKLSQIQIDSYTPKVNLALQLIRITTKGVSTPIRTGSLDERMKLLTSTPEDLLRLYGKYLAIFANITSKAFNSEDALKN